MKYMEQIGMRSKAASRSIGLLGQNRRNEALKQAAKELIGTEMDKNGKTGGQKP